MTNSSEARSRENDAAVDAGYLAWINNVHTLGHGCDISSRQRNQQGNPLIIHTHVLCITAPYTVHVHFKCMLTCVATQCCVISVV